MKKTFCLAVAFLLVCSIALSACTDANLQKKLNDGSRNTHTHEFGDWVIVKNATCSEEGEQSRECACGEVETKSYSLTECTATDIYNQSVKYVGEIVTYDRRGSEYALATGFAISSDGKIVTNYHVIEGAYSAVITIEDKEYRVTSVLAYDADIDLAVLKINASGLTAATVCKNPVSVGETVYAIGSSRGMTNTCSQGIVTYADRKVDGVTYVQHDASITHGNSGGPLINVYGEVIGINTWGISDSQNLNFAVFAQELDNLKYGTPLTLADFCSKECNVFQKLKNHIVKNGTYDSSDKYYGLVLGTGYVSGNSSKYTRVAYYYIDSNEITLDFIIDNGECWAYFWLDENVSGSYEWSYFDSENYEMSGVLYANTYDSNTLLGYSDNNITSSTTRDSIRELASTMISAICSHIDDDFSDVRVTARDLGFYCY